MQNDITLLEGWELDSLTRYASAQGRLLAELLTPLLALEFIRQALAARRTNLAASQVYSKPITIDDSQMERRLVALFAD